MQQTKSREFLATRRVTRDHVVFATLEAQGIQWPPPALHATLVPNYLSMRMTLLVKVTTNRHLVSEESLNQHASVSAKPKTGVLPKIRTPDASHSRRSTLMTTLQRSVGEERARNPLSTMLRPARQLAVDKMVQRTLVLMHMLAINKPLNPPLLRLQSSIYPWTFEIRIMKNG